MRKISSIKAEIYAQLKEKIMFLELEPGTVITEEGIAAEWGVSRTPVREVLKTLSGERLVHIRPQNKTYVAYIDIDDIKEYVFFRRNMDISILKDLIRKDIKVRSAVEESILLQEHAVASGNYKSFMRYGKQFHHQLVFLAGHELLWSFMQEARDHINRYNTLLYYNHGYMGDSVQEHKQMVEYIDRQEGDKLEELLYRHHNIDLKHFEDISSQYQSYFVTQNTRK